MTDLEIYEGPAPYERQPDESAVMFKAFTIYRDLHPVERSVARVCSELPKLGHPVVQSWAARNRWRERVLAWDDLQDQIRRDRMQRRVIENAEQVVDEADRSRRLLASAAQEWERRLASDDLVEAEDMKDVLRGLRPDQLIQFTISAARPYVLFWQAQREAMGISTEHISVQKKQEKGEDPFHTDDEYTSAVIEAWQAAGLLPSTTPEDSQESPNVLEAETGVTPEAPPLQRPKPRRRSSVPRGSSARGHDV